MTTMNTERIKLKFQTVITLAILLAQVMLVKAQVAGTVFKDFNSNGKRELPNEIGVGGISVNAFLDGNDTPFSTVTAIDGSFLFPSSDLPTNSKVRIEFVGLDGTYAGLNGANSNSTVQFAVSGAATTVSLGIIASADYCDISETSKILTACYVSGNPLVWGTAASDPALVMYPYTASGLAGVDGAPPVTYIAQAKDVGSLWGVVYQKRTKTFFMSALVRRHVGLGSLGTGGIYKYDDENKIVAPFLNVKNLGIDTGLDPHTDLPANKTETSQDSLTIHAAGKVGLGGMALSSDERKLYFINLNDRKLYGLTIGLPAVMPTNLGAVTAYTIPDPSGVGDFRPWAVTEHNEKVYVGVVTTAESTQDTSKMKAYVYQLNKEDGSFIEILSFPLSFKRGKADATAACVQYDHWNPWLDKFPKGCALFYDVIREKIVNFAMYPQPILSSIAFDADGSLLLGFMDRFGLFAGYRNKRPVDDGILYDGFVGGDIHRAQYDPFTKKYTLESNGKSGDLAGCGVGNNQGPGGGEFFCKDEWIYFGNPAHEETTNGGILVVPGLAEVLVSAMDPVDSVYQSGGMRVFDRKTGNFKRGYALYSDEPGTLGKSGGVGELKLNCSPAPIEIGNRLWSDIDFDGIQDPAEGGIANVIVSLFDMDAGGVEVGKDTTNNEGVYGFNLTNVPTLDYNKNYQIRLQMNQSTLSTDGFTKITIKDAVSGENSDERDSDGMLINNVATIDVFSGNPAQTNNSYDMGFVKCIKPNAGIDVAFCEPTSTYKLENAQENQKWSFVSGASTAIVEPTTGEISGMNVTGEYLFALVSIPVGASCADTVKVSKNAIPNGGNDVVICYQDATTTQLTPQTVGGTWATTAGNPSQAIIDQSGKVTGLTALGIFRFVYSINNCTDTVNVRVNNCNFGEIGNYIWLDEDNDGLQGASEKGVEGIIVELYQVPLEIPLTTSLPQKKERALAAEPILIGIDTTDATGKYLFSILPTGSYFIKVLESSIPDSLEVADNNKEGNNDLYDSDIDPINLTSENYFLDNSDPNTRVYIDLDIGLQFRCYQPEAGNNVIFCAPAQTYQLINAETGQFWKYLYGPTGVELDTLTGQIEGISKDGDYKFLLIYNKAGYRCSDSVSVSRVPLANGGNDLQVCLSKGTGKLTATTTDGTWAAVQGNPSGASITNDGTVTGLTTLGKYRFVYTNSSSCKDTVNVNVVDCDFGKIGDTVWLDSNDNGLFDTGESGVSGIIVQLYKVDNNGKKVGTPVATDTTDVKGNYLFDKLADGMYQVAIVFASIPTNHQISDKQNQGTNKEKDSDFSRTTGCSATITIDNSASKNVFLNIDAALKNTCKMICVPFVIQKSK